MILSSDYLNCGFPIGWLFMVSFFSALLMIVSLTILNFCIKEEFKHWPIILIIFIKKMFMPDRIKYWYTFMLSSMLFITSSLTLYLGTLNEWFSC